MTEDKPSSVFAIGPKPLDDRKINKLISHVMFGVGSGVGSLISQAMLSSSVDMGKAAFVGGFVAVSFWAVDKVTTKLFPHTPIEEVIADIRTSSAARSVTHPADEPAVETDTSVKSTPKNFKR